MSSEHLTDASSPEMLESRQAAIKNRIITHLNADHAFSLQIWLRHFCAVPENQAITAKITDVTNDYMILESRAGRNLIPLEPPMKSLMEARERSVAMHNEALAGLGLSNTKIDTFALPNKAWQIFTCAIVAWCIISLPFRSKLPAESGSLISRIWSIGGLVPGLTNLAYTMSPITLPVIFVIHTVESVIFARTRLRKYQVPMGSTLWWSWMTYVYLGGMACFTRFDELVRLKEEAMKKNEKH